MLDLLTIALEAHSDERNHHRRYEVAVGRDLLGHWVVTVRYGRVGQPLRKIQYGSPEAVEARTIMYDRLRRRLSAPRRIGCRYRMVEFTAEHGSEPGGWLPGNVLGKMIS